MTPRTQPGRFRVRNLAILSCYINTIKFFRAAGAEIQPGFVPKVAGKAAGRGAPGPRTRPAKVDGSGAAPDPAPSAAVGGPDHG